MQDLINERKTLTDKLAECERGDFPGSPGADAETDALIALADFDAAHPEVLPEIRNRNRRDRHSASIWS